MLTVDDLTRQQYRLYIALKADGYQFIRWYPAAGFCGLQKLISKVAICVELNEYGYERRFCFASLSEAAAFYDKWDGITEPVVGKDGCVAIQ